jgi:hypothetical protein
MLPTHFDIKQNVCGRIRTNRSWQKCPVFQFKEAGPVERADGKWDCASFGQGDRSVGELNDLAATGATLISGASDLDTDVPSHRRPFRGMDDLVRKSLSSGLQEDRRGVQDS